MSELKSKVALITGAAQGIGKATALVMASYGAIIIAADMQKDGAEKTICEIERLGQKGLAVYMDVTNAQSVTGAVDEAVKTFGKIDILVNAAGIAIASKIEDLSEELWDKTMDINAKGVFLCSQAVIKNMIKNKKGKIINVSSQTAKLGEATNGAYCCSKAAVSMLTQVLALEMAQHGINVNAVCPGPVDTEMMEKAFVKMGRESNMEPKDFKKSWLEDIPLKRMARPEEIGEIITFLAGDKSDYITGVSYTIAGGSTLI